MNEFEKVDKLRERANVTYEEARDALNEANGDLLDAMVILEKKGKTTSPQQTTFRTTYEEQTGYERVEDHIDPDKEASERFSDSVKRFFRTIYHALRDNYFSVRKKSGDEVVRVPLLLLVIVAVFIWKGLIPLLIVLLFFGFRYSVDGKDDLEDANEILNRAGHMADSVREEMKK